MPSKRSHLLVASQLDRKLTVLRRGAAPFRNAVSGGWIHALRQALGLSAAALAVANREVRSAYSPIVIAGVMRLIDFGLISLSGVALSLYWTAAVGDSWHCLFLTFGIAAAAVSTTSCNSGCCDCHG